MGSYIKVKGTAGKREKVGVGKGEINGIGSMSRVDSEESG